MKVIEQRRRPDVATKEKARPGKVSKPYVDKVYDLT